MVPAAPIEVFQLTRDYQADPSPAKVSLGVGAYRTDEGKPWLLPCVKTAETLLAGKVESEELNHEYLPVLGLDSFTSASVGMLLGEDSPAIKSDRAIGVQALSGTGALRIGAEFLQRITGSLTTTTTPPPPPPLSHYQVGTSLSTVIPHGATTASSSKTLGSRT